MGAAAGAGLYVKLTGPDLYIPFLACAAQGKERGGGGLIISGPGTAARDHDYRPKFTGLFNLVSPDCLLYCLAFPEKITIKV